ncbi:dethiobiotin synthase [uncultured Microscilla sp.]|uniref:dethiobiotin synthase n=1 Tax=uncultured Microscilla sp. TaxID=432653 RepID=UPI002608BDE1|nr:dethiobiotin synthase [uncultured Microscilla sp.]
MKHQYIIAGIDTEIGKTVVSAIVAEALQADYWKPIQSGELDNSDTHKVEALVSNHNAVFHPEAYRFKEPMSPHAAAAIDGVTIEPNKIQLPDTRNHLVVELAGGLMVPLTHEFLNIHLIKQLGIPVILVSKYYLGSINHTLLSIELLKAHKVDIKGIIFNGEPTPSSKEAILAYSQVPCLGEIPWIEGPLTQSVVSSLAKLLSF